MKFYQPYEIISFQVKSLPTGFGDAGNGTCVGLFAETDTAHFKLANIAVRSAADFATIVFAG